MKTELRRDLGKFANYATLIGTMVGSGIFVVTGESGAIAGPSVVLAYLMLAPALFATAMAYSIYCSTPLGEMPGGAYVHITRTHGFYYVGYIAAWLKCVAYVGSLAVLSLSVGQYLTFFIPKVNAPAVAIGVLVLFYLVNVLGIRHFGRVQLAMVVVLIAAVVILVLPGLFAVNMDNFDPFLPFGWAGLFAAMAPLFYAYQGFESIAQTAGETKQARRRLPRMYLFGIAACMVLYVAMSFVAFGVVQFDELAKSDAAMALVASKYLPFGASAIVAIGAIMAFATSINGCLMVPSRLLYVLANDRVLPRQLARVNSRLRTPDLALTLATAIAIFLVATKTLNYMVDVVVQAFLLLYTLHSITLVLLPFVRPRLLDTAWFRPPTWLIVVAGVFSAGWLSYLTITTIPDVAGLLAIWVGVGTVLYAFARWRGHRDGFDYKSKLVDDWAGAA